MGELEERQAYSQNPELPGHKGSVLWEDGWREKNLSVESMPKVMNGGKELGNQSEMPSCMPSQGEGAQGWVDVWFGAGLCHAESGSCKVSAVCVTELLWWETTWKKIMMKKNTGIRILGCQSWVESLLRYSSKSLWSTFAFILVMVVSFSTDSNFTDIKKKYIFELYCMQSSGLAAYWTEIALVLHSVDQSVKFRTKDAMKDSLNLGALSLWSQDCVRLSLKVWSHSMLLSAWVWNLKQQFGVWNCLVHMSGLRSGWNTEWQH